MATLSDNTRGALLMMASMAAFTLNDACMKAVGQELPFFQAVFLRGVATPILLAGIGDPLIGRFLHLDALEMKFGELMQDEKGMKLLEQMEGKSPQEVADLVGDIKGVKFETKKQFTVEVK